MPNPTCSTCRWFEFWHPQMAPGDDDDEGDCRRFPETKQTFGCCSACGEHSPRPEAREGLVPQFETTAPQASSLCDGCIRQTQPNRDDLWTCSRCRRLAPDHYTRSRKDL